MASDRTYTTNPERTLEPADRSFGIAPGRATLTSRHVMRRASGTGVAPGADLDVERASTSSGEALPRELRSRFESSLDADLSGVRVHTGCDSEAAAAAVGAKAYATGNDIHFGAGEYDPGSAEGQWLIAHEVAHTVQQAGGSTGAQYKLEVSAPGDAAETEADAAAHAMVSGESFAVGRATRAIHRKLNSNDQSIWDDQHGDAKLAGLKAAVAAWKGFRDDPKSQKAYRAIPGGADANALVEICRLPKGDNFKGHAAAELGAEALVALGEMASFDIPGFTNLAGFLPGVNRRSPAHKYTLQKSESLGNSVPKMPIAQVTISYANAFGWSWTRDFAITGLSISVSAKGLSVTPGVDVKVTATASAATFRGYEDFDGAAVSVVTGPSVTINGGVAKGKASSGGIIKLRANGLDTDFVVNMDASLKEKVPTDPSKKPQPIDIGLGAGGAVATGEGEATSTAPEIVRKPVQVHRQYPPSVIKGFETGKAEVDRGQVAAVASKLSALQAQITAELGPDKAELDKALGYEQKVRFRIRCEGYASRIWKDARNDTERKAKNDELSFERANNVVEILRGAGDNDFETVAHGASVRPQYAATEGAARNKPPVSESDQPDAVKDIETEKAKGADHDPVDYSSKSNDDETRAVWVYVTWEGYKLGAGYGNAVTTKHTLGGGPAIGAPGGGGNTGNNGQDGNDAGTATPQAGGGGNGPGSTGPEPDPTP